jgi:hypothetical protein
MSDSSQHSALRDGPQAGMPVWATKRDAYSVRGALYDYSKIVRWSGDTRVMVQTLNHGAQEFALWEGKALSAADLADLQKRNPRILHTSND